MSIKLDGSRPRPDVSKALKDIARPAPPVDAAEVAAASIPVTSSPAGQTSDSLSAQMNQALTQRLLGQVDHRASGVSASNAAAATASAAAAGSLRETFDGLQTIGGGPAQAQLLQDNLDSWNARWEMLEGAKTSIDSVYFSLEKDVYGYAFLGHLLKKQLDGVPTRVMVDAMADTWGQRGFKMPLRGKDYLQELANHGGKPYIFHPIWQRPGDLVKGDYSPLASDHDKILVVDGQKGITGGRNIGIDYLTSASDRPHAWRDIDVALDGAGPAAALTKAMDVEIAQDDVARPVSPDRLGNWVKRDVELVGAYVMMDEWLKDPPLSDDDKARLRQDPAARSALAEQLVQRAVERLPRELPEQLRRAPGDSELAKLRTLAEQMVEQVEARGSRRRYDANKPPAYPSDTKILDQTSAAGKRVNDFDKSLTALCDSAQKRIVIENPYVVLTESMLAAMERAAKRGVQIDIVTNSPLSTDSAVTQAFFLEDWPQVLARCPNSRIFVATGERKFHGKSAVIDDDVSLVTTYNLDLLSGYVNSEVGAAVWSREMATDLKKVVDGDLADPKNGFIEYKIRKYDDGRAVVKGGKPQPLFGPEDHLPQKVLDDYKGKRKLWGHTLRNNFDAFIPLRHPPLADTE